MTTAVTTARRPLGRRTARLLAHQVAYEQIGRAHV